MNSALYELLPFRTLAVDHAFTRALTFGQGRVRLGPDMPGPDTEEGSAAPRDLYSKSVLTASATLGRVDDSLA